MPEVVNISQSTQASSGVTKLQIFSFTYDVDNYANFQQVPTWFGSLGTVFSFLSNIPYLSYFIALNSLNEWSTYAQAKYNINIHMNSIVGKTRLQAKYTQLNTS